MVIFKIETRWRVPEPHAKPAGASWVTVQILIQIELIHTPGVSEESSLSCHLPGVCDFPVLAQVEKMFARQGSFGPPLISKVTRTNLLTNI